MQAGDQVDGKYELVRLLGSGGMGAVWEARHTRIGLRVALKFLRAELAASAEASQRFLREAQAAAAVGSDHIVSVTDVGGTPETGPYLVMEFLEGESLANLLDREGPLSPARAAGLVVQVCRGLGAAHARGIIHRDIKPENLFLTRRGDGAEWIKVLDFGIAKVRDTLSQTAPELTATGSTMGTPYYMSPEQAWGRKDVDHRADQYSTGVLLYELLTRARPFDASSYNELVIRIATTEPIPLRAHRAELPAELEAVVLRAMGKEPEDRFPSMAALAEALSPWAGGAASASVPPPSTTAPARGEDSAASAATSGPLAEGDLGSAPTLASSDGMAAPPVEAASLGQLETGPTLRSADFAAPGGRTALPAATPAAGSTRPARERGKVWPWVLASAALVTICLVGAPLVLCIGAVRRAREAEHAGPPPGVGPFVVTEDGGHKTLKVRGKGGGFEVHHVVGPDGRPVLKEITIEGPAGAGPAADAAPGEGSPPGPPPPGPELSKGGAAAPGGPGLPPRKLANPERLAKAWGCFHRRDYDGCIRLLRGWRGDFVGTRLLHRCLERSGRHEEACAVARRHPGRFRKALATCGP